MDSRTNRPGFPRHLLAVFVLLAAGIITAGCFYYWNYERHYRAEVERQISAVAKLKTDELADWREDRLGDAAVLFRNAAFSALVRRHFDNPEDVEAREQTRTWLSHVQAAHRYDRVFLLDAQYSERMIVPDPPERITCAVSQRSSEILRSGEMAFEDFYRNEQDQRIYLKVLVPILEAGSGGRMVAVVALRVDPETYLYPYIEQWPTPSLTAETLIVRRDGNDVLFLNNFRFQKDTALNVRVSLAEGKDLPAVKAAMGQEGIVEGRDYRGVPVVAAVRAVPNSPWFLVARMDTSEVYEPLWERLRLTVVLVGILVLATGAAVRLVWRQRRLRFYREKAEVAEALRESEEKYRILFQTMAQGVIYQSADGKITSANSAAERILGLPLDEMQGRTSIDPRWRAIHEDGSDFPGQTHPAMVALQTGREVRDVVMGFYNPRTESHVWINVNAVPRIEPGYDKPCQVYTTFDDITERRRAEEETRRFAAFPVKNPSPVLAMSMEGQFLFANPAAVRTFPTLSAEGLRHCIMADWPSVADALRRRSPPIVRREVKVDGAWYLQVFFHTAELNRVLVYLIDITDRKQADEAARKAQAELLEQRQHEKEYAEAELARMRDRLVRATRLAAIGQVSASIAHDLRNPLGTVRNAAYYLGRRLPKGQPEVAEYLGIIDQEVAAADRIITNLLAVARAKETIKQPVDLGQTIREALAQTGQAEAVRLRMSLAPEPFIVRADSDQLRQVFHNLVANAVEAMKSGGEIVVEAARDAHGDSIVLRDTGPGVAQEIRETAFEPLVTTKAKGIGLGLTICREFIEHHGGSIELIDEDKPGAAFRIRLPRQ